MPMGFHPIEESGRLELGDNPSASLISIQSLEPIRCGQADPRLGGHHVDAGQ
jgi:hypothetical protein